MFRTTVGANWHRAAALVGLTLLLHGCATRRGADAPPLSVAPPLATAMPAEAASPLNPPPVAGLPMVRVRVTDAHGTRVVSMTLDEYVLGAVRAELPPRTVPSDAAGRLLQVQAVVSRTYGLANLGRHKSEGFDLCDSTHCQMYRERVAGEGDRDPAAMAVSATRGQVITYEGRVIQALFHSNCGGHTTSAGSVWGGPEVPYLRPVPDWFCTRAPNNVWSFTTDEASLRQALNGDARTQIGMRLDRIDIVERDPSGRAVLIAMAGTRAPLVRAEEFRTVLRRVFGQGSIRSTWFSVTRNGERFVFSGVGYGHGVGLCQTGAALRAEAGQSPTDIIAHYFPGTRMIPAAAVLGITAVVASGLEP